jgi:predicted transcriptional regulator
MTELFEKGVDAVRALAADRQDLAGELLLRLAGDAAEYELTPEQLEDVRQSLAEADRGEFATDRELAETWKKFGR